MKIRVTNPPLRLLYGVTVIMVSVYKEMILREKKKKGGGNESSYYKILLFIFELLANYDINISTVSYHFYIVLWKNLYYFWRFGMARVSFWINRTNQGAFFHELNKS